MGHGQNYRLHATQRSRERLKHSFFNPVTQLIKGNANAH